jgi:GNAT superfamily N-acetyltransferase
MPGEPTIRQAAPADAEAVVETLHEAARWLESGGRAMWKVDELDPARTAEDVGAGLFVLAEHAGDPAGVMKFQLEDPVFWPEVRPGDAAYVHRLAVRRRYAGTGVSKNLLGWALERTRAIGRRYLRLDCEASRPRLRSFYESFGFRYHSDRHVGPYHVSRFEFDVAGGGPESGPRAL